MLVTDGVRTFTLFNYEDNGVQWTKGYHVHYDGKVQLHAQVGFSAGDYIRWVKSLESCMLHVACYLEKCRRKRSFKRRKRIQGERRMNQPVSMLQAFSQFCSFINELNSLVPRGALCVAVKNLCKAFWGRKRRRFQAVYFYKISEPNKEA